MKVRNRRQMTLHTQHFDRSRSFHWSLIVLLLLLLGVFALIVKQVSRSAALEELGRQSTATLTTQANELQSEVNKFRLVPFILSENDDVIETLSARSPERVNQLNKRLEALALETDAAYIFVFDISGTTVASSNFRSTDSFVGESYEFRPYVQQTLESGSAAYFAKGETTGKSGLFLAGKIADGGTTLGGIVLKVEFDALVDRWNRRQSNSFVADDNGIILFSNDSALTYKSLRPLTDEQRQRIISDKQFEGESLARVGLEIAPDGTGRDSAGQPYLVDQVALPDLGWEMFQIAPMNSAVTAADTRAYLMIALFGVVLFALAWLLRNRVLGEARKRQMTDYLKSEVTRQTQELSVANEQLKYEISEREQVNQRFRSAREALAQANRLGSIGTITASVAHELNQPVAAIRARAENAKKWLSRGNQDRAEDNLGLIVELTERIGTISTELRRYARRGSHAITRVALTDVLDGVQILIGDRLISDGINFIVDDTLAAMPEVRAGCVRLEQVFVNLLQNALDALGETEEPTIQISFEHHGEAVIIYVSDNGAGVSEANAKKVFEPFFTDKPNGMGLGLGIAKDILVDFAGDIKIDSPRLGGITFVLTLERYGLRTQGLEN